MAEYIDPDQFIISRKRKKYRFAKFHNSPLCFEYDEWPKLSVDYLEIGAGNGLFTVEQATTRPDLTYLAVDVKGDRLQRGATEAEIHGLSNVSFVRARGDQLASLVSPHSVRELWITFPDPFPRKRSAGRRLTAPFFLSIYRDILADDGALYLKHDNRDFFVWSLEQLVANGWRIVELSFDLHESTLADHYKILTTYETKWLAEGLVTHFVKALPPAVSPSELDTPAPLR
jgi:tRNA (guanine-N7-)-methyltransferase